MPNVRLLPPELSDKIAAGEVVERPASVVKELVENSLDAGADRITISISGGGLKSISVRDNGTGMDPADARLALKRHATSKVTDEADLFRVKTMGFRGEALPAVASVSRFTLTTRPLWAEAGFRITLEGGLEGESGQVGAPPGTTVRVEDLFFNTPARLKFLKTERTETAWIKEAVVRLALARPDVYFELIDDGRPVITLLPVERQEDRLAEIFGPEAAAGLLRLEEDHPAVRVTGWISPPEASKTTARNVYTFVNRRFIKDRVVLAALTAGYQGRLERGRYPTAILFLDLEPGTVDVNVHPAKLEVRFHHAQAIHQAVRRAVSEALTAEERFIWTGPTGSTPAERFRPAWTAPDLRFAEPAARYGPAGSEPAALRPAPASPKPPPAEESGAAPESAGGLDFRYLGPYGGVYLVGQSGEDLVLIDQHAAHERIIFERLKASPGQGQPLLMPERVVLPPLAAEALTGALEELARLGLEVEPFGPDGRTFIVKSLPAVLAGGDPIGLVTGLADELAAERSSANGEALTRALASLACQAAVKAGQELAPAEVDRLLADLEALPGPLTCPHGRPILRRLSRNEIEAGFKRR